MDNELRKEVSALITADSAFDEKVTVDGVPAADKLAEEVIALIERKRKAEK